MSDFQVIIRTDLINMKHIAVIAALLEGGTTSLFQEDVDDALMYISDVYLEVYGKRPSTKGSSLPYGVIDE